MRRRLSLTGANGVPAVCSEDPRDLRRFGAGTRGKVLVSWNVSETGHLWRFGNRRGGRAPCLWSNEGWCGGWFGREAPHRISTDQTGAVASVWLLRRPGSCDL